MLHPCRHALGQQNAEAVIPDQAIRAKCLFAKAFVGAQPLDGIGVAAPLFLKRVGNNPGMPPVAYFFSI